MTLNALAAKLRAAVYDAADGLTAAKLVPANGVPAMSAKLDSASDKEASQKLLRGSLLKLTLGSSDSFYTVPATGDVVVWVNGSNPGYRLLVSAKWEESAKKTAVAQLVADGLVSYLPGVLTLGDGSGVAAPTLKASGLPARLGPPEGTLSRQARAQGGRDEQRAGRRGGGQGSGALVAALVRRLCLLRIRHRSCWLLVLSWHLGGGGRLEVAAASDDLRLLLRRLPSFVTDRDAPTSDVAPAAPLLRLVSPVDLDWSRALGRAEAAAGAAEWSAPAAAAAVAGAAAVSACPVSVCCICVVRPRPPPPPSPRPVAPMSCPRPMSAHHGTPSSSQVPTFRARSCPARPPFGASCRVAFTPRTDIGSASVVWLQVSRRYRVLL